MLVSKAIKKKFCNLCLESRSLVLRSHITIEELNKLTRFCVLVWCSNKIENLLWFMQGQGQGRQHNQINSLSPNKPAGCIVLSILSFFFFYPCFGTTFFQLINLSNIEMYYRSTAKCYVKYCRVFFFNKVYL